MIIALIGDIHGNLPALEAVLEHAHVHGAEAIWNIGDFVGYGPYPDEVVRTIRELNILSILGNYDRKVLKFPTKKKKWEGKKHPEKMLAFEWAYNQLSSDSMSYLQSLPENREFEVLGWPILMTHASPAAREEHIGLETPPERLNELAAMTSARIIIFGHSHQPFVEKSGHTWFINTGSVGRPDDGDPRACYAILHLQEGDLKVSHYRVDYDVQKTINRINTLNLPKSFARMFSLGLDLNDVNANFS